MTFELIYDVSLFKWNTGTVRIISEYDVAGGVVGIINNQFKGVGRVNTFFVGRYNVAENTFVCFILGGKLVAVINSMGLSSVINGGRWGGIMDTGEI